MTAEQLKQILDETGYPVAYDHFEQAQEAPFLLFAMPYTNNVFADDKVLKVRNRWNVYLATEKKDIAAEQTIENVLDSHIIAWNKSESYIEDEKLYQTIYELMEV